MTKDTIITDFKTVFVMWYLSFSCNWQLKENLSEYL